MIGSILRLDESSSRKGSFRCRVPNCGWSGEVTADAARGHVKSHHPGYTPKIVRDKPLKVMHTGPRPCMTHSVPVHAGTSHTSTLLSCPRYDDVSLQRKRPSEASEPPIGEVQPEDAELRNCI